MGIGEGESDTKRVEERPTGGFTDAPHVEGNGEEFSVSDSMHNPLHQPLTSAQYRARMDEHDCQKPFFVWFVVVLGLGFPPFVVVV
ncbi:hypothetical protein Vadar_012121 [Vaccinium darrowii]|uniref:Uncharacterized protein n=1 Tax=Vaccinium darrowii TaxID=229202 RepID=A0ACB7X0G6_9ERIC|nr:hypothetical protein Vadar_012121 [Vaccinium darrowii]